MPFNPLKTFGPLNPLRPLRPLKEDPAHPFQLVKFLSWSSLGLILGSSLVLAIFIANSARQVMLKKNHEFALLLAENLNHQIYQRFTLPTILGFGRIRLKDEVQYDRLDKTVQSTIHSFHVLEVRIYDGDGIVSYATDRSILGNDKLAGKAARSAYDEGAVNFEIENRLGSFRSFFAFHMGKKSIILRTTYPLRAEHSLKRSEPGPIMGALEFSQDITDDYETVILFQWLIILLSFVLSLVLFYILFMMIRRADRIILERSKEKERLKADLHQSEKLASMGRMVATIAHEIRNPLGIISSTTELLQKKAFADKDPDARLLKAVFEEAKRLSRILNDFLDYARPRLPRMDQVNLDQVLDHVASFLDSEAEKQGAEIKREYGQELAIKGDRDLLHRAFYNVVANGLQAMDKPGKLTISVAEDNGNYRLAFADTGSGFDLDMIDKYLEPFYTTRDSGTGLGLAIVKNIVENHGGTLTIANTPEGGGLVEIALAKA